MAAGTAHYRKILSALAVVFVGTRPGAGVPVVLRSGRLAAQRITGSRA